MSENGTIPKKSDSEKNKSQSKVTKKEGELNVVDKTKAAGLNKTMKSL